MTTLGPYATRYLRGRRKRGELSSKTARDLSSRLDSFTDSFGDRPIAQLGPAAVERWMESIGHLAPASRRAYLSTVSVFCRWLVKEKAIDADPTREIPKVRQPRSVPRALAERDVTKLIAHLPDERARAIVWLMVGLGLRRAEVAGLEVGDYDPVAAVVTVTGKGGHQRVVPVPPEAAEAIDAYVGLVGATYGPLIRSYTVPSAPLGAANVGRLVSVWMKAAGVKQRPRDGVSGHALRHTAASDVLDRCHDLRVVQAMLGHAHLTSSAIYLRRADLGQIRDAMKGRSYGSVRGIAKGFGRHGAEDADTPIHPSELAVELKANAHVDNLLSVGQRPVAHTEGSWLDLVPTVTYDEH